MLRKRSRRALIESAKRERDLGRRVDEIEHARRRLARCDTVRAAEDLGGARH